MFCPNCGSKLLDGVKFCSNCGAALSSSRSSIGGTVKLRCKNCNGIMNVKEGESIIRCPYCGEEEMMIDSEDVAKERIRSRAYTDVESRKQDTTRQIEMERLKHEKEMEKRAEIRESSREFKKSKLRKWVIAFAIICALFTAVGISGGSYLGALISGVQTVLFLASWILGMGTSQKHWLHRVFALFGFILIVPFLLWGTGSDGGTKIIPSKLEWPTTGLAAMLPKPDSKYGEVSSNYNDLFRADVKKTTMDQYQNYLSKCKEMGFTIDEYTSSSRFEAFNTEGYDLSLSYSDYDDGEMSIRLAAPTEMTQISWPTSGPAILLPLPKSLTGNINTESSEEFNVQIGNTPIEDFNEYIAQCQSLGFVENYSKSDKQFEAENINGYSLFVKYEGFNIMRIRIEVPEDGDANSDSTNAIEISTSTSIPADTQVPLDPSSNTDGAAGTESTEGQGQSIRPDFKEFVDSYEAFYDQYVEFLSSYDSSDLSMLSEYTELVGKAAELDQKADAYQNDDDLTQEELKYLLDAEVRIEQKLLSVE